MKLNIKSIFITGLITGLVILISGLSMIPLVGDQMNQILANRGLPPLSNFATIYIIFVSLCNGIFLVFLYALLRPLWKSKTKAGIMAALISFFMHYLLGNFAMVVYGFMPLNFTILGTVWGLGELLLGGIVASKLYKEKTV
ncbi:MAG: hypothetical protein H6Q25_1013 [Bacteroidetes bacterium]|nr:hypothetical protein [Bacteroidota bacterium]